MKKPVMIPLSRHDSREEDGVPLSSKYYICVFLCDIIPSLTTLCKRIGKAGKKDWLSKKYFRKDIGKI
jgi:hypothetical protein